MQETADRIRQAALAVFIANGYVATSMAQIRQRAAVSNAACSTSSRVRPISQPAS
jgi:AcrR family transcriptional regulator